MCCVWGATWCKAIKTVVSGDDEMAGLVEMGEIHIDSEYSRLVTDVLFVGLLFRKTLEGCSGFRGLTFREPLLERFFKLDRCLRGMASCCK